MTAESATSAPANRREPDAPSGAVRAASIAVALAALVAAPALAWSELGLRGFVHLLAPDAFYYLAVALRSEGVTALSFDGVHATNGFHPLWQLIVFGLAEGVGRDSESLIIAVACASVVLSLAGDAAIIHAAHRAGRPAILACVATLPGIVALFTLASLNPVLTNHSPWVGFNGMESPLSLAIFGLALNLAVGKRGTRGLPALRLGLVLPWIVLARLDDIFLPAGLALAILSRNTRDRVTLQQLALLVAPTLAIVALYLAFNLVFVGQLLPTSGQAKASVALISNLAIVIGSAIPASLPLLAAIFDPSMAPVPFAQSAPALLFKVATLVVPAGIALAYLSLDRDDPSQAAYPTLLRGLALYVLLKAGYCLLFVTFWDQGAWYWVLTSAVANLLVLEMAPRRLQRPIVAAAACAALFVLSAGVPLLLRPQPFPYFDLWEQRERVQAELDAIDPALKLIEFDDGIINYALREPTISGFGLTLDPLAARAFRAGRFLEVAQERGFNAVATSFYLGFAADPDPRDVDAAFGSLFLRHGQNPSGHRFRLLYADPATRLIVAKIVGRQGTSGKR